MKYKVGDKVIIRKDLNVFDTYDMEDTCSGDVCTEGMITLGGEIATIVRCSNTHEYYDIDLNKSYCWTDEMFEGFAEDQALETNNQDEIPYINALEARNMFDNLHTTNELRKIVYGAIRECAKEQRSVIVDVAKYPLEVRELINRELEFKGFSVCTKISGTPKISIAW